HRPMRSAYCWNHWTCRRAAAPNGLRRGPGCSPACWPGGGCRSRPTTPATRRRSGGRCPELRPSRWGGPAAARSPGPPRPEAAGRSQFAGLVATEGARPLTLDVLSEAEARQLLGSHLGAGRVTAEAVEVAELTALCARLPLALAITAARAALRPAFPLASVTA